MAPTLDTAPRDVEPVLTWTSEELLQGRDDVVILHGEDRYHLKRTKNGKLIMMK